MCEWTDTELVKKTLAGDNGAFGLLVERHFGTVLSRIGSRVVGYHDRQDLAQDIFLRAHAQLPKLRQPERLAAWLGRIADNQCRRWYRRKVTQLEFREDWAAMSEEAVEGRQNDESDAVIKSRLSAALARISAPHREALHCRYVRNLSYRQMSLELGCATSAVRSRLQKARNQLRKEMQAMKTSNERGNLIAIDREISKAFRAAAALRAQTARDLPDRTILHGILLEKSGAMVVTDGRRILIRRCPGLEALAQNAILGNCVPEDFEDIVEAELAVGVREAVMSREGHSDIVFPLLDGKYPEYRHVIPTAWTWRFRAPAGHLLAMCDDIAPYAAPRHPPVEGMNYVPTVRIALCASAGALSVSTSRMLGYSPSNKDNPTRDKTFADAPDWEHTSETRGETERNGSGEDVLVLHMNLGYFRDAIEGVGVEGSDKIDLQFVDASKAVVVRPSSEAWDMAVVMPMRM